MFHDDRLATLNSDASAGTDYLVADPGLWKRYSPHHEFPLSTLISIVLYFGIVLILAFFGMVIFEWTSPRPAMTVDNIMFGGSGLGEGGPDMGATTLPEDPVPVLLARPSDRDAVPQVIKPDLTAPDEQRAPSLREQVEYSKRKFERGPEGSHSYGYRNEGGNGLGRGAGFGDGPITGMGRPSARARRVQRWVVRTEFRTWDQYLDRLAALGAVIAFPRPDGQFGVVEDLARRPFTPVIWTAAQLQQLNRIHWQDNSPEAVAEVAQRLGMDSTARQFWVFFPRELENALLAKEQAFRDLTEAQLEERGYETVFSVARQGKEWDVRVLEQRQRNR